MAVAFGVNVAKELPLNSPDVPDSVHEPVVEKLFSRLSTMTCSSEKSFSGTNAMASALTVRLERL